MFSQLARLVAERKGKVVQLCTTTLLNHVNVSLHKGGAAETPRLGFLRDNLNKDELHMYPLCNCAKSVLASYNPSLKASSYQGSVTI